MHIYLFISDKLKFPVSDGINFWQNKHNVK